MNLNILMIGPGTKEKGGIATVINNFAFFQEYVEVDAKIFFVTSWKKKKRKATFLHALREMRRKIADENIDVVHFHTAQKGSFYRKSLLAWFVPRDIKVVFHMHASQFDSFYQQTSKLHKWLIRHLFSRADLVVALSRQWQIFYQEILKTPVEVIPNAVPMPDQYSYANHSNKVITLGRVGARKGTADLIETAKQLPELAFYVYGDGEIDAYRSLTKKQGATNVHFMGWIDSKEKATLFADVGLHFLPSYQEGLPMAILESMSFGVPNLATRIGGIPEVISARNGFLTEPGDIEQMVRALNFFFSSESNRKQYSQQARKEIENNFSLKNYFIQWHQLYAELIGGKKDDR